MTSKGGGVPDWELEQLEIILEAPEGWQLVIAGPGTGKSTVACQRVAYLIDEAVPPSRILLVSFTRTAVTELRDRIVSYAAAGQAARSVRISTIDSHAWSLRTGFDDEPPPTSFGDGSYELGIQRTVDLFESKNPDLLDFMARLEHLIVDEAQDVVGLRADLVIGMLKHLSPTCGVTILADPAQALYGFTSDSRDENAQQRSLLERLPNESPRVMLRRTLEKNHRATDGALAELFLRTRRAVEVAENAQGHVAHMQKTIRESCGNDVGVTSFESLADFLSRNKDESMLVLFRRRADVITASSYCSKAGIDHRLRMSELPTVVRPWLGWLLGEMVHAILDRDAFDALWQSRSLLCSLPFAGEERDTCWELLRRLAAGARPRTLDLVHLRSIVSRARPPIELCYPDLGSTGPILGTIHASKGREADTVVLVMPLLSERDGAERPVTDNSIFEEARVYYVGATRARKMLVTAGNAMIRVGHLESHRIYRLYGDTKAQLEVGRRGDVDRLAHLAWSDARDAQLTLARHVGRAVPVKAVALPENDYALRIFLQHKGTDGVTRAIEIGELSSSFQSDLRNLWSKIDSGRRLRPAGSIPHLYLAAVGTVGLSEHETNAVKPPFDRSALALAPVVKGFPMINFLYRRRGGT